MPRSSGVRPVVATSYLKQVTKDFEKYGEKHLVPAMSQADCDADTLLAALRFTATRRLTKQHVTIREVLTTPRAAPLAAAINDAALEALLRTTNDSAADARFLLPHAFDEGNPAICEVARRGLKQIGRPARDVLLTELGKPEPMVKPRKIARLLMDEFRAKPPVGIAFWDSADPAARQQTAEDWRHKLAEAGE